MSAPAPATTRDEVPVVFEAGGDALFGVITRPTTAARGIGVIGIIPGGGRPLGMNRNRLSVGLARTLAAEGFHAMRFDYHGIGESDGVVERFRLDEPFVVDLAAAAARLREEGAKRLFLIGSCFGARTVVAAAPSIPGVERVLVISFPIRDMEMGERLTTRVARDVGVGSLVRRGLTRKGLAGLLDPRERDRYRRLARAKWRAKSTRLRGREAWRNTYDVSQRFLTELADLLGRGIEATFVFGEDEDLYEEFVRARDGALGDVLASAGDSVDVATIPGWVHGFTRLEIQDAVADLAVAWAEGRRLGAAAGG